MYPLEYGLKIRAVRREGGLTQDDLGAMMGKSRSAISKREALIRQTRAEFLYQVLRKLKLKVEDIFDVRSISAPNLHVYAQFIREITPNRLMAIYGTWIEPDRFALQWTYPIENLRLERWHGRKWEEAEIRPMVTAFFGDEKVVKVRANGRGNPIEFLPLHKYQREKDIYTLDPSWEEVGKDHNKRVEDMIEFPSER